MLLPTKHIRLSESIIGLGAFVLASCATPQTVDSIWYALGEAFDSATFPAYHSFDNLLMALSFLYAIGAIEELKDGRIAVCG